MLSAENNRLLTQVGPGTPMGEYLRRYWMPIGGATEFDQVAIKPMRLFGEDLVLYRDRAGTFGLIDRQCPHRRADLALGFVEECGIRCHYHGWLMDADGRCIEQPYDDIANPSGRSRERGRTRAYPVQEAGGLVTNADGSPYDPYKPDALASNGTLHAEMLECLRVGPAVPATKPFSLEGGRSSHET